MLLRYLDKALKMVFFKIAFSFSWVITYVKFRMNGVSFFSDFVARGIPIINVNLKGHFEIGRGLKMHSGKYYNMIGRQQQCYFIIGKDAVLKIGNNVGLSCVAIVCHTKVVVGNNVRIGGGVVIYDTDFHSLNSIHRTSIPEVLTTVKKSPVIIEDGVFIGAHAIILKGAHIGENAIIGAGAVVSGKIPANQIWGGNPAKFIKTNV